jgi:hypothetical protein
MQIENAMRLPASLQAAMLHMSQTQSVLADLRKQWREACRAGHEEKRNSPSPNMISLQAQISSQEEVVRKAGLALSKARDRFTPTFHQAANVQIAEVHQEVARRLFELKQIIQPALKLGRWAADNGLSPPGNLDYLVLLNHLIVQQRQQQ